MEIEFTIPAKKVKIDRCYHTCPYFRLDGGPGSFMYCGHPTFEGKGYDACIISHPECDNGFPKDCPLLK